MSKGVASAGSSAGSLMKTNSASGSTWRRISQAQASAVDVDVGAGGPFHGVISGASAVCGARRGLLLPGGRVAFGWVGSSRGGGCGAVRLRSLRTVRVRSGWPTATAAVAWSMTARYSSLRAAAMAAASSRSWGRVAGWASHTVVVPPDSTIFLRDPIQLLAGAGIGRQRDQAVAELGDTEAVSACARS